MKSFTPQDKFSQLSLSREQMPGTKNSLAFVPSGTPGG